MDLLYPCDHRRRDGQRVVGVGGQPSTADPGQRHHDDAEVGAGPRPPRPHWPTSRGADRHEEVPTLRERLELPGEDPVEPAVVGDRRQRRGVGVEGQRHDGPPITGNRPTSSAVKCCASAALPPLPADEDSTGSVDAPDEFLEHGVERRRQHLDRVDEDSTRCSSTARSKPFGCPPRSWAIVDHPIGEGDEIVEHRAGVAVRSLGRSPLAGSDQSRVCPRSPAGFEVSGHVADHPRALGGHPRRRPWHDESARGSASGRCNGRRRRGGRRTPRRARSHAERVGRLSSARCTSPRLRHSPRHGRFPNSSWRSPVDSHRVSSVMPSNAPLSRHSRLGSSIQPSTSTTTTPSRSRTTRPEFTSSLIGSGAPASRGSSEHRRPMDRNEVVQPRERSEPSSACVCGW